MDLQVISLLITIFLALLGYLVTQYQKIQLSKRKEQLELINKRLDEFYGPLFVSSEVSRIALTTYFENREIQAELTALQPEMPIENMSFKDSEEWRLWINTVLMPLNIASEKVILEKAYLIREAEMPSCLLQFVAHISAYKALIRKWESGESSVSTVLIRFPDDFRQYVSQSYRELKGQQLRLIGQLQPKS